MTALSVSPTVRAVIYDIGGVFLPWPGPDYFARWAKRLGFDQPEFERLLWLGPDIEEANLGRITAEEYCNRCARRLSTSADVVLKLVEGAFSGESLDVALVAQMRALRVHVRVAALTNNWSFARRLLDDRGIGGDFDLIVTSAEEGLRKPDSRIYRIALERLRVAAEEAVFVDDSEENVEAAKELGLRCVRHRSTLQTLQELRVLLGRDAG